MIFVTGGRFARSKLGGTLRIRVQVLTPPAPAGGVPTPIPAGTRVTILPVNQDGFRFHDGAPSDEVTTDLNGYAECLAECTQDGISRISIECAGHPTEYLDVQVGDSPATTLAGTTGPGPIILRRAPRAPAPVAQQIIVIE